MKFEHVKKLLKVGKNSRVNDKQFFDNIDACETERELFLLLSAYYGEKVEFPDDQGDASDTLTKPFNIYLSRVSKYPTNCAPGEYSKIALIKAVRALSRLGLREAKDVVDAAESHPLFFEESVACGSRLISEGYLSHTDAINASAEIRRCHGVVTISNE